MNKTTKTSVASMPIWKWIIELIAGVIVFSFIYGMAQGVEGLHPMWLRAVLLVFASAGIMALLPVWTRIFEKKWNLQILTNNVFRNLAGGFAIGMLFFPVVICVFALSGRLHMEYTVPMWGFIGSRLCAFLLVACGEELLFRGILFRMIDERFGMWSALWVSGLIFGFAHIFEPDAGLWSSLAIAVEAGLLLGAAYKCTGSLWMPVGIHWAWNFTQGNILGFPVSGYEIEESVFRSTVSGSDLFTGGTFGPEASIVAFVLGTLLSAVFIWQTLRHKKITRA